MISAIATSFDIYYLLLSIRRLSIYQVNELSDLIRSLGEGLFWLVRHVIKPDAISSSHPFLRFRAFASLSGINIKMSLYTEDRTILMIETETAKFNYFCAIVINKD